MIETAIIYIKRNKIKSLIIILIIATIILGEIIGLLLSNASEKSERDAYLYNGAALVIEDDNGGFTKSDYDEIRKVKYVTGLGAWRELIADPVEGRTNRRRGMQCAPDHPKPLRPPPPVGRCPRP